MNMHPLSSYSSPVTALQLQLKTVKYMFDKEGNRTYKLLNTSRMLCQVSYAFRSVPVKICDISKLNQRGNNVILL